MELSAPTTVSPYSLEIRNPAQSVRWLGMAYPVTAGLVDVVCAGEYYRSRGNQVRVLENGQEITTTQRLFANIRLTIRRASKLQDQLPENNAGEDFSIRVLREQHTADQASDLYDEGRLLEAWSANEDATVNLDILEQEALRNGWL